MTLCTPASAPSVTSGSFAGPQPMQAQISMDFPISEILIRTKSPDFPIGNFDLAQATGFPNLEKPHCVDGDGPR